MKVTRRQIAARGLSIRCPNCGGKTLFREGSWFHVNASCPRCGLPIERDEGFFLGSISLNYGMTIACWLVPIGLLAWHGVLGGTLAMILAIAGAFAFPILFYRSSRSWWLMNYYLVLPQHLPANQPDKKSGDDTNL